MWGSSIDNLYAVGFTSVPLRFGFALRFDGAFWRLVDSGASRASLTVDGSSNTDVWIGTQGGGVLGRDPVGSGYGGPLRAPCLAGCRVRHPAGPEHCAPNVGSVLHAVRRDAYTSAESQGNGLARDSRARGARDRWTRLQLTGEATEGLDVLAHPARRVLEGGTRPHDEGPVARLREEQLARGLRERA